MITIPHTWLLINLLVCENLRNCFICCCFWFISIFSVQSTKTIPIIAPPTHVFLAFSYSTLRVQFGIEVYGYNIAEAESLKINLFSHSNIGLCVTFRLIVEFGYFLNPPSTELLFPLPMKAQNKSKEGKPWP